MQLLRKGDRRMGDARTRVIRQDLIDMCLNCDKTHCTNCVARRTRYRKKGRPLRNYNPVLLQQLIAQNLTNKQICCAMEICERTLKRYKKKLREEQLQGGIAR